ncbi:MAG: hypothetical protein RL431_989 [Actinomycetota bacterium]|jgi:phosphoglycolate phosphatase
MPTYTAILWDMDGTIIDSAPGIFESFRYAFDRLGIESPSDEQLRAYLGPPLLDTFQEILGCDEAEARRAVDIYREDYLTRGVYVADVYPGVRECLTELRDAGVPLGLASSKGLSGINLVAKKFDLRGYFDAWGTASDDQRRSSKAEVVAYSLDLLQESGHDVSSVILVGDRIHDVDGAAANGIESVLVGWGYGDESERNAATHFAAKPADLMRVLGY